jgi:hypothetical protein
MIEVHRRTRTTGRAMASGPRRDLTFAACRDDQVAFETAGHGNDTKAFVPIIGARTNGLTNLPSRSWFNGPSAQALARTRCSIALPLPRISSSSNHEVRSLDN